MAWKRKSPFSTKPKQDLYATQKQIERQHQRNVLRGSKHRRMRKQMLQENPWCVECMKNGRKTLAHCKDHIIPISVRPELAHDPENNQMLCEECHKQKTREERRK